MANRKFGGGEVEIRIRDRVGKGLDAISKRMKSFGAGFAKVGGALSAASGAGVAALTAAAAKFASAGDAIQKMAARTGLTAEALSGLSFAAGQSGTSIEAVEKGVRRMQQTVTDAADGVKTATSTLTMMGISLEDLRGKTPERQMEVFAEALSQIEDPGERAARAMEVFGRSGTDLLPMFAGGAEGMRQLRAEASRLGHTLTTEDANAAAELTDALGRVAAATKGIVLQIGAALAPTLTNIANRISEIVSRITQWTKQNRGVTVAIASASAAGVVFGGVLLTVGAGLTGIGVVLGAIMPLVTALGAALSAVSLPLVAIVASVAAGAAGMIYLASKSGVLTSTLHGLSVVMGDLLKTARNTFGGISNALAAGQYRLAARILWAGLKVEFFTGADGILQALSGLWDAALRMSQTFYAQLLVMTVKALGKIPGLIKSILTGGTSVTEALAGLFSGGFNFSGGVKDRLAESRRELQELNRMAERAAQRMRQPGRSRPEIRRDAMRSANLRGAIERKQAAMDAAKNAAKAAEEHKKAVKKLQKETKTDPIKTVPKLAADAAKRVATIESRGTSSAAAVQGGFFANGGRNRELEMIAGNSTKQLGFLRRIANKPAGGFR